MTLLVVTGRAAAAWRAKIAGSATTVPPDTTPMADPGTVTMLGWQGYDDEAARAAFDEAGGVLNATYIGNNDEILARLRGGQGTFDLVTPNAAFLPALVLADVLEPLDYDSLPEHGGYFAEFYKPEWNTFDGSTWGAPVEWGNGPMVYRPDLIDEVPTSWMQLADPEFEGMVAMWDDGFGHIVVMAKTLGFPEPNRLTSDQLDQVVEALHQDPQQLPCRRPVVRRPRRRARPRRGRSHHAIVAGRRHVHPRGRATCGVDGPGGRHVGVERPLLRRQGCEQRRGCLCSSSTR